MVETLPLRVEEWLSCLRENGYRLTAPRQAVIEVLAGSRYVLSPQDVYERARDRYPGLGLVTVYRTMDKLAELGLLQRVHQPTGCQGFVAAFSGHQHLLICQQCGLVEYIEGDHEGIDHLIGGIERESGFLIREHWLQFFGTCARCR
jgi:Fe2+ or Zn2+ uptake regulation protein